MTDLRPYSDFGPRCRSEEAGSSASFRRENVRELSGGSTNLAALQQGLYQAKCSLGRLAAIANVAIGGYFPVCQEYGFKTERTGQVPLPKEWIDEMGPE